MIKEREGREFFVRGKLGFFGIFLICGYMYLGGILGICSYLVFYLERLGLRGMGIVGGKRKVVFRVKYGIKCRFLV